MWEITGQGGPFLLGWISLHSCPVTTVRSWPRERQHSSGKKHDTAHECTTYQTQFVVRNWQASHVQLKWPCFPSAWKGLPTRRLWSQCYALRSQPHCPKASGTGREASPPHQKAIRSGGMGWGEIVWAHRRGVLRKKHPVSRSALVNKHLFLQFWLPSYGMHKILVLRSIYLGFAKTCSRDCMLWMWVIKSLIIHSLNFLEVPTS